MKNEIKITASKSSPQKKKVAIPQHLRDNDWAASIGGIQHKLDRLTPLEDEVVFDFMKARWIDPLPLLSLLIEIVRVAKRGITAHAHFPPKDKGPADAERNSPYQKSPNRLLLYLAREGFFSELLLHGVAIYVGDKELDDEGIKEYASLTATASYADAQFIQIRLFDVPILGDTHDTSRANFPARTVDKILNGVDVTLHSRCSAPERRHLLYTLRAVLQEFMHNAQEHAYHANDFNPAAIYVRYRQGNTKLINGPGRDFYEACIKLEISNCEQVNRDWLDARPGCLEVFFLDRGIGMVQKFTGKNKGGDFGNVMRSTFLDGKSTKKIRRTEHGGLRLLYNLMNRSNDYVRALNDKTWFGSPAPFNRDNATVTKPVRHLTSEEGLHGLAYHLRLSWKAPTDELETWQRFTASEINQVWQELCKPASTCGELFSWYEKHLVIDNRFRDHENFPGVTPVTHMLWLPKRGLMKWDILANLEVLTSHISGKCTLVIADIPTMEAAMYKAAMSQSNFAITDKWPSKIERIVLATNRWTFAYAEYVIRNGRHGFTAFHTEEISSKFKSGLGIDLPNLSFRQFVIHWLKWHDSRRFWKEVKKGGRYFLPEKVIWSEKKNHEPDKIINGYLDFPGTSHNHFCAGLYRNALSRIFGILDEKNCLLVSVDRLADPVVHDVYAHEVYDPPKHDHNSIQKIATGSVLVSGLTLDATGLSDKSIHFFIHSNSERLGDYPSLFHWMPNVAFPDGPPSQKRIGKTSAIAPEGWLSIEIPRYDSEEKHIGYRSPEESYEDWQNSGPVIAKIGHWHYEGHHDFITINIPDAVADAFTRNGSLAQYLLTNILHPLGIGKNQIKGAGEDYPSYPTSYPSILVYRSHPSSERIIDNILGTLEDPVRLEVMKWIFPVLPLRRRWGGSTLLVPPRMREEMRTALEKRKRAIIFDDAAISGRTVQDLLTSLRAWGATEIPVVTIANRLRLPAETKSVTYYWRLDVPTMGRQGSCPLCQALEAAKSLAREMVASSAAYEDLQCWIRAWSHASPLTEWDSGLNPLPLLHPQEKNYCYRHSKRQHLCKLRLYRSTGLTIHAAEVHAMTASDDYALKKLRDQSDAAIQIELAASQLFLFGDELDIDLVHDFAIDGLLEPLTRLQSDSPYGQLAVLTLMRVLSETDSKQARIKIANKAKEFIEELKFLRHGQILLAFLISQELIELDDDVCYVGARLLTTRHSNVATKLRSLFRETVTSAGNIHSEPIPALLKALKNGDSLPLANSLFSAKNSLAKLRDIIKELGLDWAASDHKGSYIDKRNNLENCLLRAEAAIREEAKSEVVMELLQEVQTNLNAVADCYFHRISPDEEPRGALFEKALTSIWEQFNWEEIGKDKAKPCNPIIRRSPVPGRDFGKAKWVWLLWHAPLQMMVKDLLMNAIYPEKQIADPWITEDSGQAHMWVQIKYTPESAILSFANYSSDPAATFEEIRIGAQNKTRWDTLTELGGRVDLDKNLIRQDILSIQVYLPYAPYLQHGDITTGEQNATV